MTNYPKHLHVTCAIIELGERILAAQRSEVMSMPFKWEFPGGKIRSDETPEECLIREIHEELGVSIRICKSLEPVIHSYPEFMITLYPFVCSIEAGHVVLHEHAAIRWLTREELLKLDWAEADIPVLKVFLTETT